MRVGLAHQHEVQALRAQRLAKRFMAVQVVAQHHRAEFGPARPVALQPAPRRVELAVLLGAAVLRRDELRGQCHHLVLPGLHQHRRDRAVAVQGPARMAALRALRAVQRRGREIRHPIQSQQHLALQRPVALDHALVHQPFKQGVVQWLQRLRRHRIQQVADLVVARDLVRPEHRLHIVAPLLLLHAPLVLQERRALHEEHRERAHPRIGHAVVQVLASATIGQLLQYLAHPMHHLRKIQRLALDHPSHDSLCLKSLRPQFAPVRPN